jgi:hypothetical protein
MDHVVLTVVCPLIFLINKYFNSPRTVGGKRLNMAIRDLEEIEALKNNVPNDDQIVPNIVQSLIIFLCFLGLTCCLMALSVLG